MGFVQVIEYQTSNIAEIEKLAEEYQAKRAASGDGPQPLQVLVTKDRDRENIYVTIVRFASYEDAMENSRREDTAELARRIAELCDSPASFRNLEVVMEGPAA